MNNTIEMNFSELYPIIKEKIELGQKVSFTPNGTSMLPVILGAKDKVFLESPKNSLKKNDIVFYRRKNGVFVLHRVIKVYENEYNMCGDNQYAIEKGIEKSQIIAVMTSIVHKNKTYDADSYPSKIYCAFLPVRRFCIHVKMYLLRRFHRIFG